MRRRWRPIVIGGAVAAVTFALAQAQIFAPSSPAGDAAGAGDAYRGETIFQRQCASCHGDVGEGGGVGPMLTDTGLDAAATAAAIQQGRGIMPAAIVTGREQADVVAYVVSISSSVE